MAKQIEIKITAAIVIDGDIVPPRSKVTVDETTAKNLMQRGKAELSTVNADDDGAGGGEKPLGKMTVDELKVEAKELGIEGADDMNKAKLIAAIKEAADE